MTTIKKNDATAALQILSDTALRRENEISRYKNAPDIESNDKIDSPSPMFDSFYQPIGSKLFVK